MKVVNVGVGAAATVITAVACASMFADYFNDKTALPLADVTPDPKRFPHYIQTKQGHWLFWRKWTVPSPVGVVFLAHGYAEHCGRYEHTAQYLMKSNVNVYAVDHQGHGQSTGTFTYFERFQHVIDDFLFFIETVISTMSDSEKKLPKFLFGHSMGGAIAIHIALSSTEMFAGVILSAPMVAPDPSVATPFKITMASMLSSRLPKLPVGNLKIENICSDRAVTAFASFDRLYSKLSMSSRVAHELLLEMKYLQSAVVEVRFPYYVFYGDADKITSGNGISEWHQKTSSADKSTMVYHGLFHEVLLERESEVVLDSIGKWIKDRLKQ